MCYGPLKSFTRGFLLWFICQDFSSTRVYATPLNNSEEIKNIFSTADAIKNTVKSESKGAFTNRSFTEGGLIDINILPSTDVLVKKLEQNSHNVKNISVVERQNITSLQKNVSKSLSHNSSEPSSYKTLLDTNLPEPGSDLFLGAPEVIHINGASSIKPRKGVDNDNKENYNFISNHSCFWLNTSDCYNAEEAQDLECTCCNKSNLLGEIFKQQASVDCSKCKPMFLSAKDKSICKSICCKQIFHDVKSVSITQDDFVKLKNNSKSKPTITKVPYDVEVVTEILSKAKQKVLVPVVSLLLLPVIGIFIFFIWKRTKEYWDKRFYKRMDFLIDGMYND